MAPVRRLGGVHYQMFVCVDCAVDGGHDACCSVPDRLDCIIVLRNAESKG